MKGKSKNLNIMTAVEWFAIQLYEQGYFDGSTPKSITNLDHLQEQAKQMEKEQIINAFDEGQEYEYQVFVNSAPRFFSDTYYNETYGSNGSDEPIELLCSTVEVGKSYLSKGCGIGEVIEYDSIIQMFKVKYQSGNTEYVNLYGLATHVNNVTATDFDLMLTAPTHYQTLKENHIVDTNEMVEDTPMLSLLKEHLNSITTEQFNNEIDEIHKDLGTSSQTEISDEIFGQELFNYFTNQHNITLLQSEMHDIIDIVKKMEQTEISNEEIEEMLFHHSNEYAYGFKDAIKWYREQLKQRQ